MSSDRKIPKIPDVPSESNTNTWLYISPIVSTDSNFILDHHVRASEIENCYKSLAKRNVIPVEGECACRLTGVEPYLNVCQDGYIAAGNYVKTHHNDYNGAFEWCVNPANVPSAYKPDGKNIEKYDAYISGCINGIRGKHNE